MINIVVYILMAAVAVVLFAGLINMVRKDGTASTSQLLMRWRVLLQFIAVVALMFGLYLSGK